jgi:hypothetical protein
VEEEVVVGAAAAADRMRDSKPPHILSFKDLVLTHYKAAGRQAVSLTPKRKI